MPKVLPWITVISKMPKLHLDAYLTTAKTMVFKTSNKTNCTICPSTVAAHKMAYQLTWCSSSTCADLATLKRCTWRGRIDTCTQSGLTSVSELSSHLTTAISPKTNQLTRPMRGFTRDMAQRAMKPAEIRNTIIDTLDLDATTAPMLSDVQNCVSNYRRTHMSNTDLIETLTELANRFRLSPSTDNDDAISLGYERDAYGLPDLGDGTNKDPFIFGLTTINAMKLLDQEPENFIFHIDATFKLNQSGYPVIVCGITHQDRSFRPIAFFIVSQRTEVIFARVLQSMCLLFNQLVKRQLRVKYVMGDADDAQYNAIQSVLGQHHDVVYLMCFYHVVAKVAERARSLPRPTRKAIFDDVYDMHFARSQSELESVFSRAWSSWSATPEMLRFGEYFYRQWLTGKFMRWQCYHTATGFAATNNPVEQFNKVIKREYTLRVRLKVGALIEKFATCIRKYSKLDEKPAVSQELKKLKRRMLLMTKCAKLRQASVDRVQIAMLLGERRNDDIVRVVSLDYAAREDYDELSKSEKARLQATMSSSNARMEYIGMPPDGWSVNVREGTCPCSYYFKYRCCVHLLFGLHILERPMPWEPAKRKRLKNRTIGKRARDDDDEGSGNSSRAGRPPTVGFALSFE